MNTEFFKSFAATLLFNIATIVAIVVGVVSYTYRAASDWYNNGGRTVLINNGCKAMAFVNRTAERIYYHLEDADAAAM